MRKFPWFVGLIATVGCGALSDAFTAHPDVVVRVDDTELTVGRFAELLVLGQPLPLTPAVADELARHWVNVTALAGRSASGDSLMDTTTVLESMWLEKRQSLLLVFHGEMFADRDPVTPEAVDSAYRVGDMRLLAHVLRRVTPESTAEEKGQQLAMALRLRDGLMSDTSWEEANEENEDETARANNGSLGIVKRGQTVPRFENAAYALAPGELSNVVETEFGYHIIYRPLLDEVRETYKAYPTEVSGPCRHRHPHRVFIEPGRDHRRHSLGDPCPAPFSTSRMTCWSSVARMANPTRSRNSSPAGVCGSMPTPGA